MTAVDLYRVLVPFPIVGLAVAFLLLGAHHPSNAESLLGIARPRTQQAIGDG